MTLETWPYPNVEAAPGEHERYSIAVSLKRIADTMEGKARAGMADPLSRLIFSNSMLRNRFIGKGTAGGSCGVCSATWMDDDEHHNPGCCIAENDKTIAILTGAR